MACGILVHESEVGPKLLRWEVQVRTTGLTENLRHQGIFIGVRSHGVPHFSTMTQLYSIAYKLPVLEASGQTTSKTGTQSRSLKKKRERETAKKYVTDEGAR